MPRPRKDYIVLDSVDATSTAGVAAFQIKPHMYSSWRHGDEMTMKLIVATLTYTKTPTTDPEIINQAIKYYGNISPYNQYSSNGLALLGSSNTRSTGTTVDTVTTFDVTTQITEVGSSPELYCDRLNDIKITAQLEGDVQVAIDLALATFTFMFEINYYSRDE